MQIPAGKFVPIASIAPENTMSICAEVLETAVILNDRLTNISDTLSNIRENLGIAQQPQDANKTSVEPPVSGFFPTLQASLTFAHSTLRDIDQTIGALHAAIGGKK